MKYSNLYCLICSMFLLAGCGSGSDSGLTEEQKFLLALRGTWIGTADEVHVLSASNRVVMDMTLPEDGGPALEGLTGDIWFGEEIGASECDPDDPELEHQRYDFFRDGYVFELTDMAIVKNRLMAKFVYLIQWKECCEAITQIYSHDNGFYHCMPTWGGDCGSVGPNGEEGCMLQGPDGETVFMSSSRMDLCMNLCSCDATSCTIEQSMTERGVELDLTVDIENGVMLGTGLGRIEAVKQ